MIGWRELLIERTGDLEGRSLLSSFNFQNKTHEDLSPFVSEEVPSNTEEKNQSKKESKFNEELRTDENAVNTETNMTNKVLMEDSTNRYEETSSNENNELITNDTPEEFNEELRTDENAVNTETNMTNKVLMEDSTNRYEETSSNENNELITNDTPEEFNEELRTDENAKTLSDKSNQVMRTNDKLPETSSGSTNRYEETLSNENNELITNDTPEEFNEELRTDENAVNTETNMTNKVLMEDSTNRYEETSSNENNELITNDIPEVFAEDIVDTEEFKTEKDYAEYTNEQCETIKSNENGAKVKTNEKVPEILDNLTNTEETATEIDLQTPTTEKEEKTLSDKSNQGVRTNDKLPETSSGIRKDKNTTLKKSCQKAIKIKKREKKTSVIKKRSNKTISNLESSKTVQKENDDNVGKEENIQESTSDNRSKEATEDQKDQGASENYRADEIDGCNAQNPENHHLPHITIQTFNNIHLTLDNQAIDLIKDTDKIIETALKSEKFTAVIARVNERSTTKPHDNVTTDYSVVGRTSCNILSTPNLSLQQAIDNMKIIRVYHDAIKINGNAVEINNITQKNKGNGTAEAAVKQAKKIFKLSEDPYLAILQFRNVSDDLASPNEKFISKRTRSTLPTNTNLLYPKIMFEPDYNPRVNGREAKLFNKRVTDHTLLDLTTGYIEETDSTLETLLKIEDDFEISTLSHNNEEQCDDHSFDDFQLNVKKSYGTNRRKFEASLMKPSKFGGPPFKFTTEFGCANDTENIRIKCSSGMANRCATLTSDEETKNDENERDDSPQSGANTDEIQNNSLDFKILIDKFSKMSIGIQNNHTSMTLRVCRPGQFAKIDVENRPIEIETLNNNAASTSRTPLNSNAEKNTQNSQSISSPVEEASIKQRQKVLPNLTDIQENKLNMNIPNTSVNVIVYEGYGKRPSHKYSIKVNHRSNQTILPEPTKYIKRKCGTCSASADGNTNMEGNSTPNSFIKVEIRKRRHFEGVYTCGSEKRKRKLEDDYPSNLHNLRGAIDTLIDGSGLRNLLEAVYGERAAVHMLSGKAMQRTFRGHLLIDRCLNEMVVFELIQKDSEFETLVARSEKEYQPCLASERDLNDGELTETLNMIHHKLCEKGDRIATKSKTSELWFRYQNMIKISSNFIRADRSVGTHVLKSPRYMPTAVSFLFGWLISRPNPLNTEHQPVSSFRVSIVDAIAKFWELESIDESASDNRLCNDLANQLFAESICKTQGYYQVGLPWKHNHPILVSNKSDAQKCLNRLERKLTTNQELSIAYHQALEEFIDCNYIEEVIPDNQTERHLEYYLPYRPVVEESSTFKVKSVFDASAKDSNGHSLNDCLILSPVIIKGKMLMQILWKLSLDWDQSITDGAFLNEIKSIDLQKVEQLEIPRCYFRRQLDVVSLHVFCDASKRAYSAVVYVTSDSETSMILDTGSAVTILNSYDFTAVSGNFKHLQPPTVKLKSYMGNEIKMQIKLNNQCELVSNDLKLGIGRSCHAFGDMRTIDPEIESVINKRPITYISEDRDDPKPLRAVEFLLTTEDSPSIIHLSPHGKIIGHWKHSQIVIKNVWKR
ncbi:hypothetical protein GQR58_011304 [Nymphon striatum]|nr:hypothetical protein GQR58_011304 [Nymphon striatum]